MPSVLNDPQLDGLLAGLHQASKAQDEAIERYFFHERTGPWNGMEPRDYAFMADKLEALHQDKAEFCYILCRAIGARRIFEAGTSFGVSTLYLAAAVRDNGGGAVIGTEHEPQKAKAARAHFAEAELTEFIDLREGDLRETLKHLHGPIDFVLVDIWTEMARPAIELIAPHLRIGAVVCADNTGGFREPYRRYFDFVEDPANGFRTMTLPFEGGFEFTVKVS